MKPTKRIETGLEIEEPDKGRDVEIEYSGKIEDLKQIHDKKDRAFLTKLFGICACGVFIFTVLWGAFTKDWDPFTKSSDIAAFIFGYLMSYYFG